MGDVYVYPPDCEDFSTIGECGRLTPISCEYEEIGNGNAEITLTHPIDAWNRYTCLRKLAFIKADIPVRTTPEIRNGQFVTTVEKWKVKATATKPQRYIYSRQEKGSRRKLLSAGAEVIVTEDPEDGERYKVKYNRTTGWMERDALESNVSVTIPNTPAGIEEVVPSWETREQIFCIYAIEKDDTQIVARAKSRFYDLMDNITTYDVDEPVELQEALDGVLGACLDPHPFKAFTDIKGTRVGVHANDTNPVQAMLDPDKGLAVRWNAQMVRDDEEIYLLSRAGRNRGVRIEYAKNLKGIKFVEDISGTYTHVRPVGETKNGEPLYLNGTTLVESKLAANYPHKKIYVLKCADCKVGTDKVTVDIARQRMVEQAEGLISTGIDMPKISAKIDFINLGDTPRYRQYKGLEKMFLFDTVQVWHPVLKVDVPEDIVQIKWDCCRDKMISVELGDLQALTPSVSGWQISGSINGSKLERNSVGSSALASNTIAARHIQAESIYTDALQAMAVTASKIAAGAITADKLEADSVSGVAAEFITARLQKIDANEITTDELYAAFAEIISLMVESLNADNISTDRLGAALGEFVAVYSHTVGIDFADIKDMTTGKAIIREGAAGELYIDRLVSTSANILSGVLGELIVKGSDGGYYQIVIGSDGNITTLPVNVTDGEAAAGQTGAGQAIVETTVNVRDLNAQSIKGSSAIITEIFTDALTAGKITAGQAMIASATVPELYTTAIKAIGDSIDLTANTTIRLLLATNDLVRAWFTFTDDGMTFGKSGSTYSTRVDDVGFHVLQLGETIASINRRQVNAEAFRIGKVSATDPRIILREAPDGGAMFVREEIQ